MITEYKMVAGTKDEIVNYYSFVDNVKYRWMADATVEEQMDKIMENKLPVGFIAYLENTSDENWKAKQDAILLR